MYRPYPKKDKPVAITKLKIALSKSGYKQIYVSAKLGIDNCMLSKWATGDRQLPPEKAKIIAKFLKVPIWHVDEDQEEPPYCKTK